MTAPDVDAAVCPHCEGDALVAMSDGMLLCLECRLEWDPADPPNRVRDPLPATWVTADDVLGPPDEPDHAETMDAGFAFPYGDDSAVAALDADAADAYLDELRGTRLVLEGGQVVTVLEVVDEDWVRVRMNDDREEVVAFSDVVRSVPTPADRVQAVDDVPDDAMRILVALAGLAHATVQAFRVSRCDPAVLRDVFGTYIDDEMPDDADLLPVVIGDVVTAAQALATAFDLPADIVKAFVNAPTDEA